MVWGARVTTAGAAALATLLPIVAAAPNPAAPAAAVFSRSLRDTLARVPLSSLVSTAFLLILVGVPTLRHRRGPGIIACVRLPSTHLLIAVSGIRSMLGRGSRPQQCFRLVRHSRCGSQLDIKYMSRT